MKRAVLLTVAAAFAAGCTDTLPPAPDGTNFAVSDAVHTHTGFPSNPHFFFLPPLVPTPASFNGDFNAFSQPTVEIRDLGPHAPVDPTVTPGCGFGTVVRTYPSSAISVDPVTEVYQVEWNTGSDNLTEGNDYRVCVKVFETVLGYRDVRPVSGGAEVPRNPEQLPIYEFNNGNTRPIKFRIEKGALCGLDGSEVVDCTEGFLGPNGGTLVCEGELCGLQVEAQSLVNTYLFVVELVECPLTDGRVDYLDVDLPQFPGCLRITVQGETEFTGLLREGIAAACLDADGLPPAQAELPQLHIQFPDGNVQSLPTAASGFLDCANFDLFAGATASIDERARNYARAAWRKFEHALGPWFSPPPLGATHKGFGGSTTLSCETGSGVAGFDEIQLVGTSCEAGASAALPNAVQQQQEFPPEILKFAWALPAQMEKYQWINPAIGEVGDVVNPTVLVLDDPVAAGETRAPLPVAGATVNFTVLEGDPLVPAIISVVTGSNGQASVPWPLSPAGLLTLEANGFGIGLTAAEGGSGAFANHFGNPVLLGTGRLEFDAIVCEAGVAGAVVDGTIDGNDHYGEGEYVPVKISGGQTDAWFYATNDCENLYLALEVVADPSINNALRFVFDNDADDLFGIDTNNDGLSEEFDDVLRFERDKQGNWVFTDRYIPASCASKNGQSDCSLPDPTQPPLGSAAFGVDSETGHVVYEIKRALNSGDPYDFQIELGNPAKSTVGYYGVLQLGKGAQGNTEFPDFRTYAELTFGIPTLLSQTPTTR